MKKLFAVLFLLFISATLVMAAGEKPPAPVEVTPPKPAKEAIILKVAHADSVDIYSSRKHAQAVAFANFVNARSGGKLVAQVYGAGALGGEREYVEGIKAGTIEAGIASGVLGSFFPQAMITDIPYLFPSSYVAWEVMDGPFGDKLRKMFLDETGIRCLGFAEVGFRNFTNNARPIHTPDDMKGLKFRVMETPLFVTLVKSLGASPTPIAWPEVYSALQTGVVDGQENPVPVIFAHKLYEVQKYLSLDKHVYGVDWFLINEKFFQSLSPELQYIILDSARIANGVGRGVQNALEATGISALEKQGMEIYVPTETEMAMFKKAAQKPVIDWLKTKIDASLIDEILREVDRVVATQKQEFKW
jgi:tripartite ATP-independent transporter DctP family solute receptor